MAMVRMWTAVDRRRLRFDMTGNMNADAYVWEALVFEGDAKLGTLAGAIERDDVPLKMWDQGFLEVMAVQEVERSIKEKCQTGW